MKTSKYGKAMTLLMSMLILTSSITFSLEFNDIENYDCAKSSIINMYSNGYISGFPDGSFRPEAPITRAQFVSIINKMNAFEVKESKSFSDLTEKHWAYSEIMKAVSAGYINGYPDGTFRPDLPITREQIAAMLNNLYHLEPMPLNENIKDLSKTSAWAVEAVVNVISNGVMKLDNGLFSGKIIASRLDSVLSLDYILVKKVPTKSDWENLSKEPQKPSVGGAGGSVLPPPVVIPSIDPLVEASLKMVVGRMSGYVVPRLTTSSQVQVANIITNSVNAYLLNPLYDMTSDVASAKSIMREMPSDKQDQLMQIIQQEVPGIDLLRLNEKFNLIDTSKLEF